MTVSDIFKGRIAVTPTEAGYAIFGQARQTTNNQLCKGSFPLPVTVISGKRIVLVDDIQKFIDEAREKSLKPRRGRPSKASKIAAAAQQEGGV
ncbi:hypothetical protein MIZ01_1603 [Sideroxyarcus emersonii]|uniref:Uncharacterized protein n=1 Tax=Sideroxyarcus emersonii TaxID=2764705 RepID=A0AAN1XA87_9PROT|nr:hypothetical protein [Sideroxyarcus emersonii]BCK87807.1 hypothetical protein MIZ01_1603 [Sideroxyarcus emersonii]